MLCSVFFFQAEDGIRDLVRSRGLGDVYKRQGRHVQHRLETVQVHPLKPATVASAVHQLGRADLAHFRRYGRRDQYIKGTAGALIVQGLVDRGHTATIKEKIQRHQVIVPALAYISDVAAHVVGRICMPVS